ncbi:hypothetical protein [Roseateles sp. YR242]|uniref:hypothetical protein n=1 Tax=Roseateles sp. YR242 TaxID=1855305 RepID=UPI001160ADD7|nr:hypothetical protein [Roseateles sp. YR242]
MKPTLPFLVTALLLTAALQAPGASTAQAQAQLQAQAQATAPAPATPGAGQGGGATSAPPPTKGSASIDLKVAAIYYRCGPKGQDLRDTPCPPGAGGQAAELPEDKVSPDQLQAARQRAAQEARELDALQRRREQAQAQRGQGAATLGGSIAPKPKSRPASRPIAAPKPRPPKNPPQPPPKSPSKSPPKTPKSTKAAQPSKAASVP